MATEKKKKLTKTQEWAKKKKKNTEPKDVPGIGKKGGAARKAAETLKNKRKEQMKKLGI